MDEEDKHKRYFSLFEEREESIRAFLNRALVTWERIVEELKAKTLILFRKSFEDFQKQGIPDVNKHTLQRDQKEIGKGYSSLFIYHHMVSNLIIPLITSLLIPNAIDQDSQSLWVHS